MWNLIDIPQHSVQEKLEKKTLTTEEPTDISHREEELDLFKDTTESDDLFDWL